MDTGHWILDTGMWTLDTGHWTLDTGMWILDRNGVQRREMIFNRMHRWITNRSTDEILPINGKKRGQRERTGNINYFMREVINYIYNV